MSESVAFKVPFLPPSMNSLYGIQARGSSVRLFLKSEAREFKEKSKLFMPMRKWAEGARFRLEVRAHGSWFFKNGSVRKLDIMNLDKIVCDAVAEKYLEGKDERVWVRLIEKVECAEEYLMIQFGELS